jgi:hypothetical protein
MASALGSPAGPAIREGRRMSIESHPGKPLPSAAVAPTWGEVSPQGQVALVVRFCLPDRVITIPMGEFKRWEHAPGEGEKLTLSTSREEVTIEGRELAPVRAALDLGRLCEVRANYLRAGSNRPGPRIERITIEPI